MLTTALLLIDLISCATEEKQYLLELEKMFYPHKIKGTIFDQSIIQDLSVFTRYIIEGREVFNYFSKRGGLAEEFVKGKLQPQILKYAYPRFDDLAIFKQSAIHLEIVIIAIGLNLVYLNHFARKSTAPSEIIFIETCATFSQVMELAQTASEEAPDKTSEEQFYKARAKLAVDTFWGYKKALAAEDEDSVKFKDSIAKFRENLQKLGKVWTTQTILLYNDILQTYRAKETDVVARYKEALVFDTPDKLTGNEFILINNFLYKTFVRSFRDLFDYVVRVEAEAVRVVEELLSQENDLDVTLLNHLAAKLNIWKEGVPVLEQLSLDDNTDVEKYFILTRAFWLDKVYTNFYSVITQTQQAELLKHDFFPRSQIDFQRLFVNVINDHLTQCKEAESSLVKLLDNDSKFALNLCSLAASFSSSRIASVVSFLTSATQNPQLSSKPSANPTLVVVVTLFAAVVLVVCGMFLYFYLTRMMRAHKNAL